MFIDRSDRTTVLKTQQGQLPHLTLFDSGRLSGITNPAAEAAATLDAKRSGHRCSAKKKVDSALAECRCPPILRLKPQPLFLKTPTPPQSTRSPILQFPPNRSSMADLYEL
jgi:hypothetical protein